jgi:hypothetical protein
MAGHPSEPLPERPNELAELRDRLAAAEGRIGELRRRRWVLR